MSAIRSALDEMSAMADDELSPDQLAADIGELVLVGQMVDVLVARKTKSLSDRGGHHTLGFPSPTAMLVSVGRMSAGQARRVVSRAQAADKAPSAHAAWADGRISTGQADILFRAAEAVPDVYPDAEERLVDIITGLTVSDTMKTVEYWRQAVDGPGDSDLETQLIRRGVSLSKTIGGMRRIDGWLTTTAGDAFATVLDTYMPPPGEDDTRTPRQRRHDALEDLSRDHLDNKNRPTVGGERPHISLVCDLEALTGIAGGLHETIDGDILTVDTLRQVACDASVSRIILGADSETLDIGRKTRIWTTAQRRAITIRDHHCTAPGCQRPARWCDIHHIHHWADGGTTSITNGRLLCRYHHTQEHLRDAYARRRGRAKG